MESVVVSPVCSDKRFLGLEKGAGWVADWSSQVRRTASKGGAVKAHIFARMAPCSAKKRKVVRWDGEPKNVGKMGQD